MARIALEIREQVLTRIQNDGVPVAQAAQEHGIKIQTVYYWLSRKAEQGPNILQMNKLKRENEELQKLLGRAMMEIERSKKNQSRYAI